MKDKTLRRVFVFFVVIFALVALVAAYAVRSLNRAVASNDWVNHTHAIIAEIDGAFSTLRLGEGAGRAHVFTGAPRDLAAARSAFDVMEEHFEIAKALTRNDAATHERVLRLETLSRARRDLAEQVAEARAADLTENVQALLAADAAVDAIGEIGRAVDTLKETQMALLAARDRASYRQVQTTRWIVSTGVALNLVLFGGVAWLIRDDLAARTRLAATLQEANARLETKVRERTSELAAINGRLVAENLERRWSTQAIEHQLRYNQAIVDAVGDLVFVMTKALNITRLNPAVVHATGWEPQELLGQPIEKIFRWSSGARDGAEANAPMTQALREGRDLKNEWAELSDRRGGNIAARATLFPLRDRDKVVGGILILQLGAKPGGARA
ncbi:MAG TPA: CHASE3 domain-containing protein [Opitutus sp.]|nr:CHASE3 domain-containing protein [Opitutus sp.]